MRKISEYEQYAEECRQLARASTDPKYRATLEKMARAWEAVAEERQRCHYEGMNKLDRESRARLLHLLCEGNSIRAACRLTGASKKAVSKLMVDAGQAAAWYQDRVFRNLTCKRIQVDEIWAFVYQ
jgi:hypothetical protein